MPSLNTTAGICGFVTRIQAEATTDGQVTLTIESDCPSIQTLAVRLPSVDPFREITYRGEGPLVLATARECLPHPACIVPSAILKAIEVAAGLALPAGAGIAFDTKE